MIQLATALPAISVGPVKPNAAISADVSGFALAMGALTAKIAAPATGMPGKAGDAAVPLPEGQDLAEAGKELPDGVLGLEGKSEDQPGTDSDKGEDASGEDAPPPPFAWFAVAPPPTPQPEAKAEASASITTDVIEGGSKRARREVQTPALPLGEAGDAAAEVKTEATVVAKPVATSTPAPVVTPEIKPQPTARRADVQRQVKVDAASAITPVPADPAEAPVAETAPAPTTTSDPATTEAPAPAVLAQPPRELRKAAAEAPVVRITRDAPVPQQKLSIADLAPAQPATAAAAPQSVADQVFAAFDLPRQRPGANAAGDPQADLSAVTAQATGAQTATAVTATGQGQDAMLDTRDQQWTAKMIDKIAALQDASPVRETKLSLMPEGLGKVDIAIRQDDAGSLHVQFNTDTQAARQLIADAQPKLAEIAQERGIRIGSTSVESNATGQGAGSNANPQMNQGQQNDARPQRNQPSAPPSARREAPTSTDSDERVA